MDSVCHVCASSSYRFTYDMSSLREGKRIAFITNAFSCPFLFCRDRAALGRGTRDMERGKDVDRERMVLIQRERDADREAEQAVDKHFAESLKKYQSQVIITFRLGTK